MIEAEKKARCEGWLLDLMVAPQESERVRVAAAEALASASIGPQAIPRLVTLLADPATPDALRLDGYPLVQQARGSKPLEEDQGNRLLDALLRDWGSSNGDLASRALGWVDELELTERMWQRQHADRGPLGSRHGGLVEDPSGRFAYPTHSIPRRNGRSHRTTAEFGGVIPSRVRPWKRGCKRKAPWSRELNPMVLALAGRDDSHRLVEVARTWRTLGPQPDESNASQPTTRAAVVTFQALSLVASAAEESAQALGWGDPSGVVPVGL